MLCHARDKPRAEITPPLTADEGQRALVCLFIQFTWADTGF